MDLFGEFLGVSETQSKIDDLLFNIDKQVRKIQDKLEPKNKCEKCKFRNTCAGYDNTFVFGLGVKKIMIIQGSPDSSVKMTRNYTSGKNYDLMANELDQIGIEITRDCWYTYAMREPLDRKKSVTDGMLNNCRYQLLKTIKEVKPEKIILLGGTAIKGILGHRASTRVKAGDTARWAGWEIPDQELEAMVYPMYEPGLVQFLDNFVLEKHNRNILKKAIRSEVKYERYNYPTECGYIDNEKEAIGWLRECLKAKKISFDYETTGIKNDREGHKIICLAVSNGLFSMGFKMYESREFLHALWELLTHRGIQKIAHNHKYEQKWTKKLLGYEVVNWGPDPMLAAHVIDNRPGITSLKFLDYVYFGHMGYDAELDPYMHATKPGESIYDDADSDNRFNMLEYAPIDKLCLYCAEDSHSTYKLSDMQRVDLDRHRQKGLDLLMWSTQAYVRMESEGVGISIAALDNADGIVAKRIHNAEQQIALNKDVAAWRQSRKKKTFDHGSPDELKDFIYGFLQEPVEKKTKTDNPSLDKEVLESLAKKSSNPVYTAILTSRKWVKVQQYLQGIRREQVDGILHCFFNLNNVSSYRTSSNSINLQNIPKRDKEVMKLIRSIFIPRAGYKFMEYDFRAFEVSMYACYSLDEALMEYVRDLEKDMHRDMGAYIMNLSWDDMKQWFGEKGAKAFRQETKSGFVFSQLYGAGAETCAQYFWDYFQTDEGRKYWEDFRARTGIGSFEQWHDWIKEVEDYFWNRLFPKLGQWKERNWKRYLDTGKIKYFTGFYAKGVMAKTQATNFPVQGTASNVKLAVLSMLSDKLEKDGANSRIFAEIHDSLVLDVDPAEEDYLDNVLRWVVDVKIPEMYPWAAVPFYLEKSSGEIDGSWDTVEEVGIINERGVT